jgi:hypothetical protein
MSAFANTIKVGDRFVEYLGAVVKHYYLITTGAILTLILPWLETRYLTSVAAQTDLKLFIDRWSLPVGMALLFFATFRAWNEQKEIAEAASPEGLRAEVSRLESKLEHSTPRVLSLEQRKILGEELIKSLSGDRALAIQQRMAQYAVRPDNAEAINYTMQFISTLYPLGLSLGAPMHTTQIPLDLVGIVIRISETDRVPAGAQYFHDALKKAEIPHRIAALPIVGPALDADGFQLVIGAKA